MIRVIFFLVFSFNIVFSNDNVVKTSELELFLFKIGFQSLLKEVELTKNRSKLNEDELVTLNNKINIIMDELYKNKKLLKSDNEAVIIKDETYKNEIKELRAEINFLKEEIKKLSINKLPQKVNRTNKAKVITKELNIRENSNNSSKVIASLKKGDIIEIKSCNSFGWCKLKKKDGFVASFLLDFNY